MWNNIKSSIANIIKTNGRQEITGDLLQHVLHSMVDNIGLYATFAGVAYPSTNPGTPDGPVFYIATKQGSYPNFGLSLVRSEVSIFHWDGAEWHLINNFFEELFKAKIYDNTPIVSGDWLFPDIEIKAHTSYIIKFVGATPNVSKFNVYVVSSSGTIVQTVAEHYIVDGDYSLTFTADTNAAGLRIFSHNTNCGIEVYEYDVDKLQNDLQDLKSILYTRYIMSFTTPSNEWDYYDIEIVSGRTYTIKWSGASGGKQFNIYTVNKPDLTHNIQAVIEDIALAPSGEITFEAVADANALKVYSADTVKFNVEVDESHKGVFSEITAEVAKSKEDIEALNKYGPQPYKGLKILSLGDSYTYMNYYGRYLSQVTGCYQRGRGINGGHIGEFIMHEYTNPTPDMPGHNPNYPVGASVHERFNSTLLAPYDIITIMGGTNDYGSNFRLGTMADTKDSDTVIGHLKKVIERVLTLKPNAKIFICTQPYRCPNPSFHGGLGGYTPNAEGVTLEDVANAMIECGNFYGIPVFDFYHNGGWNSFNNKETDPSTDYPYGPFMSNKYTSDGLHPRDGEGNGAEMLGAAFGLFINSHYTTLIK